MGLREILALLFLSSAALALHENCTDYKLQFERVFSVPGDIAMLNSTLLSPDVFNHTSVAYSVSWYDPHTERVLGNETGRLLVRGETLWLLNVQPEDAGEYVIIVRTHLKCFRQATKLVVDQPISGSCGRPRTAPQFLSKGVNDYLSCPLTDYIKKLKSYSVTYSIKWYKRCTPIVDGAGRFTYHQGTFLKVEWVDPQDNGFYTCTLNFTLAGVMGSVSETIDAGIKEEYTLFPEVHEPGNEIIKAVIGSRFKKTCRVFVPSVGHPNVDILWMAKGDLILHPSEHIFTESLRSVQQEVPIRGRWLMLVLHITELHTEDFYTNYTCRAYSSRGNPEAYFTLLPTDTNILLPIGLVLGGVAVIFIASTVFYYIFKIDIVLWFRLTFPFFYTNTEFDGKLYDAYVAYPRQFGLGASGEVETFAFHTLPQVLERECGYKLFIAGRDCLPGMAIVDSAEESMRASRRLFLLYNASTFTSANSHEGNVSSDNSVNRNKSCSEDNNSKTCDHNFNTCGISDSNHNTSKPNSSNLISINYNVSSIISGDITSSRHNASTPNDGDVSLDLECGRDGGMAEQLFECDTAMHRALLENSLKVVLVELEKISPDQLALFPESIRHLRRKQGAVFWWKSHRVRREGCCFGGGGGEDEEKKEGLDLALSPSLSPSSRFWKEIRYYMPVRGKRTAYPDKSAFLSI